MSHRPRKQFGQNFLHDPRIIETLLTRVAPQEGDRFIEIGPGTGALTRPILEAGASVDAIEIDHDLVALLSTELEAYASRGRFRVHQADALDFDFESLPAANKVRLIGNLPYYVSTPILFRLLALPLLVQDLHFMLQKEVVDRMVADHGGREYGRLSVSVQLRCRVERVMRLKAGAFRPPPKVESAFVRLEPRDDAPDEALGQVIDKIVRDAFSQRRKKIGNPLAATMATDDWIAVDIDPGLRAEALSPEDFRRIAQHVSQRNDKDSGKPAKRDNR